MNFQEKVGILLFLLVFFLNSLLYSEYVLSGHLVSSSISSSLRNGSSWSEFGADFYKNPLVPGARKGLALFLPFVDEGRRPSLEEGPFALILVLGIFNKILEILVSYFWILNCCYLTLCALLLEKTWKAFLRKVECGKYLGCHLSKDVRDFIILSCRMEAFNDIHGNVILLAVSSGVVNASTSLGQAILTVGRSPVENLVLVGGALPSALMLIAAARVYGLVLTFNIDNPDLSYELSGILQI